MRIIIGLILFFVILPGFSLFTAQSPKAGQTPKGPDKINSVKVEKAEVFQYQPLLKGMAFVRIRCQFDNTPYYQGYKNPMDTKKEDFNLGKLERQFKETNIPLTRTDIQQLYGLLETELKDNGVRILDIQTKEETDSTVVPTITLIFAIRPLPPHHYIISMDLTATKWMSYWAGEESVQAPVIVWWQKKLTSSSPQDLMATLSTESSSLLEKFTSQLTYANAKTAVEIKPEPASVTPKKEIKKQDTKNSTSPKKKKKNKKR